MQSDVKRKSASAQSFFGSSELVDAAGFARLQNARVLDWTAIRAELRRLRDANNLTREELQAASGVEKTTIYRVENTKELPDYKPDFDTIGAMLAAMEITLSEFFAKIETDQGLRASADSVTTVPSSTQVGSDGRPPLLPLDDVGALLARNLAATAAVVRSLDGLVSELRADREQAPSARAHEPARNVRRRPRPAQRRKTG